MTGSRHTPASLRRFGIGMAVGISLLVAVATAVLDYAVYHELTLYVVEHVLFNAAVTLLGIWLFAAVFLRRVRSMQEQTEERLRMLALTDSLTGAYNHRYLQLELEKEWARMERHQHPLACILLDLDNFKQVNDKYGHIAGDVVLQHTARILKEEMREIDIVSRYGGEEFVLVLFEKPAHRGGLAKTMERIRARIEQEDFIYNDVHIHVTASLGGALAPHAGIPSAERLIRSADKAMYAAKKAGKNCCKVWDPDTMR